MHTQCNYFFLDKSPILFQIHQMSSMFLLVRYVFSIIVHRFMCFHFLAIPYHHSTLTACIICSLCFLYIYKISSCEQLGKLVIFYKAQNKKLLYKVKKETGRCIYLICFVVSWRKPTFSFLLCTCYVISVETDI